MRRVARQPADRIGDPLGHPVPHRGAEQDEDDGAEDDLAIELVDLPLEELLAERERHGHDAVAVARAHGRGGDAIREVRDLLDADEDRQPIEDDVHVRRARRAHREQA